MKKITSFFLAVLLVFTMCVPAFAATVPTITLEVDKTSISAGETVTVSIKTDTALTNLNNFELYLYYNPDALTKNAGATGADNTGVTVGDPVTQNGKTHLSINKPDPLGDPIEINAGEIATVTFTAKEDLAANATAGFGLKNVSADYDTIETIDVAFAEIPEVTIAVKGGAEETEGYTFQTGLSASTNARSNITSVTLGADVKEVEVSSDGTTWNVVLNSCGEELPISMTLEGDYLSDAYILYDGEYTSASTGSWSAVLTPDLAGNNGAVSYTFVSNYQKGSGAARNTTYTLNLTLPADDGAESYTFQTGLPAANGTKSNITSVTLGADVKEVEVSSDGKTWNVVLNSCGEELPISMTVENNYTNYLNFAYILYDGEYTSVSSGSWSAVLTPDFAGNNGTVSYTFVTSFNKLTGGGAIDTYTLNLTLLDDEEPLPKLNAPSFNSTMMSAKETSITVGVEPDLSQASVLSSGKMIVEISKTEDFASAETMERAMSEVLSGKSDFTFTGLEDGTTYYIRAKITGVDGYQDSDYSAVVNATTKEIPAVEGYTVTMPADISIVTGETASIPVVVDNADDSAYNAFDMSFTYDASKLELTSTEIEGMTVEAKNGTVRVLRYGEDLNVGSAAFTLTFKAIGTGETTVTATSAKVGVAATATELDAADATILDDATVITIGGYSVNLPDDFTGESTVAPGKDYTFEAKDKNYDYDVTAKIGDTEITVNDNGDGTFTIPADQITGNIVITSTKEGKTFDVSLGEDMTGETSAQYMTPYTATLTKVDGYTYDLKVTIGGKDYTGFEYNEETGVVTIPGADITGKVEFNSNKTQVQPSEYTVTFEGNGAGDAVGENKVAPGADYSFTLNKAEGYTYTVSYKMGDSTESVALTEVDGKYTIEKVNGNLVITVEKESDLAVEVGAYVEMDGKTVFLVRATGTLADGKAYAYKGDTMYYSNVYKAWSWLVIVEEGNTFTADDAKNNITAVEAEYTTLDQTFNVNMTSKVDVNDAQLVYNIYNCEYDDFSVATMQKFLYADTNGDKIVDTLDAAAVVNNIP